jgi:tetratricopeptide (TPR) repeat protein
VPITLDGTTHGAVLLLPDHEKVTFSRRVSPLAYLLPKVLSLHKADLALSLLEHEIRFSTFPGNLYLFLPSLGIIEITKDAILAPHDFIILEKSPFTWNRAVPGPDSPPRLSAIILDLPEDNELQLQSDGIGDLKGTKPKNKGKLKGLKNALGLGLGGLAAGPILGLGKLVNMLPDGPNSTSPSAFGKLEEWARKNWNEIVNARQRELNRLMEMMEKNPDEGLRYALPLGGHDSRRGKAPPSWTLGAASNLRLGSHQGGTPIDGWDIDYQTQLKLEQQYRKAAAQALADGNYERAAYIYGELLNDWAATAQALIKGGRLREAVSIFLHKLSDKQRAAQALEEAGLHLQAAQMYLELGKLEKAADLYQTLGNSEQARELWSKAVEKEKNPLEKARILDEKLEDRSSAIAILDQAWRSNHQPALTIRAEFDLLLKDDNSAGIHDLVTEFTATPPTIFPDLEKARLCLSFKKELLSEANHPPLEETVLRLASNHLTRSLTAKSSHQLLNILRDFREDDLLLTRDTNRFIAGSKKIKIKPSSRPGGHFTPAFELGIPQSGKWLSLAPLGKTISVAGILGEGLVVAQLQDRSCMGSELATSDFPPGNVGVFHLGLIGSTKKARVFHFTNGQKIHFRSINTQRTSEHDALGSLEKILAIGPVGQDSFMTLRYHRTGSLVEDHYQIDGTKSKSTVLDLVPPAMAEVRWHCASRDQHACYSAGQFAAWRYPDGQFSSCQLNEPINKLSIAPGAHPLHALITSQHEAALITPAKKSGKQPEFVNLSVGDGEHPLTSTFAQNGDAIVCCGYRGEIFAATKLGEPAATFGFPKELGHAIDIAPREAFGFVILTSKGRLILFD